MQKLFSIKAFHVTERLKLKDIRERFSRTPIEFSNYELVIRYSDDSYLFVYNYGSVVFFNVSEEIQEKELQAIHDFRTLSGTIRTSDIFSLEVEEAPGPLVSDGSNKVYYDRLVVSSLSYAKIKIACMLLAESTALEYYEILIENLLEKTNTFSRKLERERRILHSSHELIQFIGFCLNTKQEIISNLYIVDSPDETWESVELDKMFQELKNMMEIDVRYRGLEYKIKIIQESIEVFVDFAKSKRETTLEIVIILLIAFEIVLSLMKWH